jgi:hypothetical protein
MRGFIPAPTDRTTTLTFDQGGPSEQDAATGAHHMADDTLYLVLFHVQDAHGAPLAGASATAISDNGDWASSTNACGDVIDPGEGIAGVMLSPGDYKITFSKAGYADEQRDVTIVAEGPPIRVGLERAHSSGGGGELPPIPTRAQVCAIQHSLAGLTYDTQAYGAIPAWFYGALDNDDRARARAAHRAAGDTHIPIPVTEAYREGGTLWPPALANGYDYTQDMDTYRAIAREAIADGFFIDCALGGDGLGTGPNYNDPVGRTYGCGWLFKNLERMIRALQGDGTTERPDLTPYIIMRPGWDAVFYGWGGEETPGMTYARPLRWRFRDHPIPTPTAQELDDQQMRVKKFGELFRSILPHGYLSIEHTPGNIPVGEGGGDYQPSGLMTTFDTIMGEYNTFHEDSYWQIAGRMLDVYHRPPDQPAGDDPNPPKYLGPDSPRGPYFYVVFEPTAAGAYEWCRGRCTRDQMQHEDQYIRDSGATLTGYPVHW